MYNSGSKGDSNSWIAWSGDELRYEISGPEAGMAQSARADLSRRPHTVCADEQFLDGASLSGHGAGVHNLSDDIGAQYQLNRHVVRIGAFAFLHIAGISRGAGHSILASVLAITRIDTRRHVHRLSLV